jgi:hypothetical protein
VYFTIEREIKTSHDIQKLKKIMTTEPMSPKMMNRILHTKEKDKHNHGNA